MSNDTDPIPPRRVTAAVLIIGDEILSGRTADVNLAVIAQYFGAHGVEVEEARVVPDRQAVIVDTLNHLRAAHDYVVTTGGLGPTHDDITAACVAEAFGVALHENPEIIAQMRARWGREIGPGLARMARVPEGGLLVHNPLGGPPGFQVGNVFVLAGVPEVMRGMLQDLGWRLRGGAVVVSRTLRVATGEGDFAVLLEAFAQANAELSLGSYPFFGAKGKGAEIVVRGRDPAQVDAAATELATALADAGIESAPA
jgi:molybdenum cofactor synthesis domain-containing protein